MSTVTQHTDTYYTNRFGCRFYTREAAEEDEIRRTTRPFKLDSLGLEEFNLPSKIEAVGDDGGVWGDSTPQSVIYKVVMLRDIIEYCESLIRRHGDGVGFTRVRIGNGHFRDCVVKVVPNDQLKP